MLYGGIEAGGTKFVCAVGNSPDNIEEVRFDTTTPEETLGNTIAFFRDKNITSLGIASFGPIDLNKNSSKYGYITNTPKPGWKDTDFVGILEKALGVSVVFDTDVNGAALGEKTWGSAKDVENFIYLTIGTGIGGGAFTNGHLIHGMLHPEMGHVFIPKHRYDKFAGHCIFHQDQCFEGLACGPALEKRWGTSAKLLEENHVAWDIEAYYIACALVNYICTISPERIILGGGVMEQPQLLPKVHESLKDMLAGYVQTKEIEDMKNYVVLPGLGNKAGILGAIALAQMEI